MKILMIGPQPPDVGGIASYIRDLNNVLIEQHSVNIISIKPYIVAKGSLKELIMKVLTLFTNSIKILSMSYSDKFTLAHVHTSSGFSFLENSVYILLLKYCCGKKVVLHIHAPDFDDYFEHGSKILKRYIRNMLNYADAIIVISEHWKDIIQIKIDKNLNPFIVTNAVREEFFLDESKYISRERLGLSRNKKIIFSLGNLTERKGFIFLIEAMAKVVKGESDILCIIGGAGEQYSDLARLLDELNLSSTVKLQGQISDTQLKYWYNSADLFVFPSLAESFGLVQVEAMACGKPVVATYNGGSEYILNSSEVGYLCRVRDPDDLCEKILISLKKQWNSDTIKICATNYRWSNVAEQIVHIYKNLSESIPKTSGAQRSIRI